LNHYNTIFNSEVSSNYSSEVTEEIKNDFLKMFPEQTIFVDLLFDFENSLEEKYHYYNFPDFFPRVVISEIEDKLFFNLIGRR